MPISQRLMLFWMQPGHLIVWCLGDVVMALIPMSVSKDSKTFQNFNVLKEIMMQPLSEKLKWLHLILKRKLR